MELKQRETELKQQQQLEAEKAAKEMARKAAALEQKEHELKAQHGHLPAIPCSEGGRKL